eukprot:CAMPEP_0117015314 /NCGR_PEP_ID=MMETSP0472-20121206/12260_1 /TAXON_ID=693140 ORGANISM="Tiarina fusus, Strain LIS" /NCGR_SAMPLE_ID=MMETSP0472 /ASSEMBLY_ACC=CAM_ASM_000603 /LENGTH=66 /DNA_ID=CAMNT_0004719091 /DNA_START=374 /DNA_END=571 /DNA_ORIENTATION=+
MTTKSGLTVGGDASINGTLKAGDVTVDADGFTNIGSMSFVKSSAAIVADDACTGNMISVDKDGNLW